jgi:cysteinyl-tRNA synthetase
MKLKFYNTLHRKKEEFKSIKKGRVGLYTCGPTVYDFSHIGNLRTYIFEDILRRTLEYNGYKVRQVMNITDVGHLTSDEDTGEDKVEKAAREKKKSAWQIAAFYTEQFKKDIAALNIEPASVFPKATDHIKEQVALIKKLEQKGFTYKTSDGIYFDTSKFKDYGKLGRINIKGLKKGARVKEGEKKNITDFALWKFSPRLGSGQARRQMEWKSPWGIGFPGWHIECSAMSTKYLGQPFDIHAGGIDHIPVHHQNEIAQSEAAYNKPLANYWLHGEFLVVKEKKMAKSEGAFITLKTLEEKGFNPLAYRFFVLGTHYRKPLHFSWEALEAAEKGLKNLYNQISAIGRQSSELRKKVDKKFKEKFLKAINNDLNMPQALAVAQKILKAKLSNGDKLATLFDFDKILGLKLAEAVLAVKIPKKIKELAEKREKLRKEKKWSEADELRRQIKKLGWQIEDTKKGPALRRVQGQD